MEEQIIKKLKKGELFKLKDTEKAPVWVRAEYIPSVKMYSTYQYEDINHEHLISGNTKVFIGFTY